MLILFAERVKFVYLCSANVLIMEKITLSNTILLLQEDELLPHDKTLVDAAKEATKLSYSPYSHFAVGAAVMLDDGTIVKGCNQENGAYGNSICAERTAIFTAQCQHKGRAMLSIAVAAYTDGDYTHNPITPCGACRQSLVEVEACQKAAVRILLYGKKGTYVIDDGIDVLMPLKFELD